MEVITDPAACPEPASGSVVTIGAYDGVHLGHRAVIAEVRRVLRPRARLVVFDADWGSMTIDSDDDEGVAAFRASVAGGALQRRIGLSLRSLLVRGGFAPVDCGVSVACCTSMADLRRLASPEAAMDRAVETGALTREHADGWLAAMAVRSDAGTFWATLNRIVAVAQA